MEISKNYFSKNRWKIRTPRIFLLLALVLVPNALLATEYTGTNFKVLDPVIVVGNARVTSTTYTVLSSDGQIAIGESTSTSYKVRSGFQYFPKATAPTLTATAGALQVSLSWTSSTGYLGWTITSYDVCCGSASGVYDSCSSVGGTSKTVTGLVAGTTYYFQVKAKTVFGVTVAKSNEVSATPTVQTVTPLAGAGGAGAPPPVSTLRGKVIFSGKAYPGSEITILKNAQIAVLGSADASANFEVSTPELAPGIYNFSVYATDAGGLLSKPLNFSLRVVGGEVVNVSNIFIPPTFGADKSEVKVGDTIKFAGQSAPLADILISIIPVESKKEIVAKTAADNDGFYSYEFDTDKLKEGIYEVKLQATLDNLFVSLFSHIVTFKIGEKSVLVSEKKCLGKADFNCDGRVNLIDFSILIYWFEQADPPVEVDFNGDGKVNLVDFSILAYHWTG